MINCPDIPGFIEDSITWCHNDITFATFSVTPLKSSKFLNKNITHF